MITFDLVPLFGTMGAVMLVEVIIYLYTSGRFLIRRG